jgi:hypothetical protein
MRETQKPGFSRYLSSHNQKIQRNRVSRPMRESQKPGFSRYFSSPNQKIQRNRVSRLNAKNGTGFGGVGVRGIAATDWQAPSA